MSAMGRLEQFTKVQHGQHAGTGMGTVSCGSVVVQNSSLRSMGFEDHMVLQEYMLPSVTHLSSFIV